MSTQSIIDKAKALNAADEEPKSDPKKRQGVWETAEEFVDQDSGLGVQIRKRIRGRPDYSVSVGHFGERGFSPYIPIPLKGLKRPMHEVMYLLTQEAEKWIADNPLPRSDKRRKDKRKGKDKKERRRDEQGGLSALSKRDAEKQGKTHVGKTERKRQKKAG
jgi:hypothetical protein